MMTVKSSRLPAGSETPPGTRKHVEWIMRDFARLLVRIKSITMFLTYKELVWHYHVLEVVP